MNPVLEWLSHLYRDNPGHVRQIAFTVVTILVYGLLRLALGRVLSRAVAEPHRRFTALKIGALLLNVVLLVTLAQLWFNQGLSMASFVGLLSAGLAFIFREPLLNLAGWGYIITRNPFSVGDRIQIDNAAAGDVVDVSLLDFTLMEIGNWVDADQSTGRLIHVPNGIVFTHTVANYTQGFPYLWHELPVTVTYESDWQKAVEILTRIANKHTDVHRQEQEETLERLREARDYLIHFRHLTPIVYVSKADNGITLTIRYLCEPRRRRSTESRIWQAVFSSFAGREDIRFAYPTTRFVKSPPGE